MHGWQLVAAVLGAVTLLDVGLVGALLAIAKWRDGWDEGVAAGRAWERRQLEQQPSRLHVVPTHPEEKHA